MRFRKNVKGCVVSEKNPPMADLFPITLADEIAEVEREIDMRRVVYPRRVAAGKLAQDKADRQIEILECVLDRLRKAKGEMLNG